jgi:hypothetical protein
MGNLPRHSRCFINYFDQFLILKAIVIPKFLHYSVLYQSHLLLNGFRGSQLVKLHYTLEKIEKNTFCYCNLLVGKESTILLPLTFSLMQTH